MTSDSEQRVFSKGKVHLEQHVGELLDDYARFIGIAATEDVLNIVLRKMLASDPDFHTWMKQGKVQQHNSDPIACPTSAAEMEAA